MSFSSFVASIVNVFTPLMNDANTHSNDAEILLQETICQWSLRHKLMIMSQLVYIRDQVEDRASLCYSYEDKDWYMDNLKDLFCSILSECDARIDLFMNSILINVLAYGISDGDMIDVWYDEQGILDCNDGLRVLIGFCAPITVNDLLNDEDADENQLWWPCYRSFGLESPNYSSDSDSYICGKLESMPVSMYEEISYSETTKVVSKINIGQLLRKDKLQQYHSISKSGRILIDLPGEDNL
jgi:hypothetical protein